MRCTYCDAPLPTRYESDHFPAPRPAGGRNLVPSCMNCPELKVRTPLENWDQDAAEQAWSRLPFRVWLIACWMVIERRTLRPQDLLEAIEALPPPLDVPLLFPSPSGAVIDLHNFRNREWAPAIEAAGTARPARVYDLRSTFASRALDAGISVFELARVMATSVAMIERHYGRLLDGAGAGIAARLDAYDAEQEQRTSGRER